MCSFPHAFTGIVRARWSSGRTESLTESSPKKKSRSSTPWQQQPRTEEQMAIEVRIPTILRTYTDGEKAVDADGATLTDLIANLDASHPGLGDRLLENGELRRFINVYVNDEDVRFEGGLAKELTDGDVVVILPAVAGGA